MGKNTNVRLCLRWLGAGAGLALAAYASSVAINWCAYGHPKRRVNGEGGETQFQEFIPNYEIAERHSMRVGAPAGITFEAAREMKIQQSAIVRALFRTRSLILGSGSERESQQ